MQWVSLPSLNESGLIVVTAGDLMEWPSFLSLRANHLFGTPPAATVSPVRTWSSPPLILVVLQGRPKSAKLPNTALCQTVSTLCLLQWRHLTSSAPGNLTAAPNWRLAGWPKGWPEGVYAAVPEDSSSNCLWQCIFDYHSSRPPDSLWPLIFLYFFCSFNFIAFHVPLCI